MKFLYLCGPGRSLGNQRIKDGKLGVPAYEHGRLRPAGPGLELIR